MNDKGLSQSVTKQAKIALKKAQKKKEKQARKIKRNK